MKWSIFNCPCSQNIVSDVSATLLANKNMNIWNISRHMSPRGHILVRWSQHISQHFWPALWCQMPHCNAVNLHVRYWSLLNWQNLRWRCGCVAVPVNWFLTLFNYFLLNLRTLYIVWSLVRRRVTRRLTRLQTMCNVLKYHKILENVALRLRCGCVYFFNLLKTSTVYSNSVGLITADLFTNSTILMTEPARW